MTAATVNPHEDAVCAAALLAVAPNALRGIVLAGTPAPGRDAMLAWLSAQLAATADPVRVPPGVASDAVIGGLDLAATLAAGKPVLQPGLLARAHGTLLVVAMAERQTPAVVAAIAAAIDTGNVAVQRDGLADVCPAQFVLAALDEALADDTPLAPAIEDRVAFRVDCAALQPATLAEYWPDRDRIQAASERLATIDLDQAALRTLVATALAFGITSPRAPLLASAAARALAALNERSALAADDLAVAARLVFAPRAVCLPAEADDSTPPTPPERDDTELPSADDQADPTTSDTLDEQVLAAVAASIPDALLARLDRGTGRGGERGRGRAVAKTTARGRPAGVEAFRRGTGQRLNVLATLRTAAPWQRLRGGDERLHIRAGDLRATRRRAPTRTTTIFVVDASGSAAAQRLAEVKGAIELLLAECYVRRDEVALIAFRGTAPACLLAPTRSLARVKRELSALPGGGGTPLASAFDMAAQLAAAVRRDGKRALVVTLTDGRGNVGRDGTPGHPAAASHALAAASEFAELNVPTLVIDTGRRPRPACRELATAAGADYLPLPHADAGAVSSVVRAMTTRRAA